MTLQKVAAIAGLAVGLVAAGSGVAATTGAAAASASTSPANFGLAASPTAQPVSSQDRTFMDEASQINLAEISLGRYIQAHGTTATAKDLGARYVRDHTAAQAKLRALAARLKVSLPVTPGPQLQSVAARVEAQKGKSTDVAFARASVSGHKAAIAVFKKEERAGSNASVKAYAAGYLPMLEMHLKLAEHTESVLHVTSAPL